MGIDWPGAIVGQMEFYWDHHFRPRLDGLTDEEYLWEPVDGCWSVRPGPDGALAADESDSPPDPPPLTTIAWRMVHIGRDIFGIRARAFFGPHAGLEDADMFDRRLWPDPLPGTADEAVAMVERAYAHWRDGVKALDLAGMEAPLGPKAEWFGEEPVAALVLHLSRELMAHGAEISLLRDLYRDVRRDGGIAVPKA